MTFDAPLIDTLSIPGIALRHADALMLTSDGTAGGSRAGVRPGDTSLKVTLSGAGSTTINTAAGVASCAYPAQGVYRAYNQTSWTGTVTAAHATLDRIDLVYLRVWDNTVDSSGLAKADVVYLAGTPATTPVAPAPSGTLIYLSLATISVPSVSHGGSPAVTDVRPVAVAPGGILIDSSATAGTYTGQYRDTGAGLQRWNTTTTAWENALKLLAAGQVNVGASASPAAFAALLAATSTLLASARVTTDTQNRWQVAGDGTQSWGSGSSAMDAVLARVGAGLLGVSTGEMIGVSRYLYKASSATPRTNSTLANDPDLTVTLNGPGMYVVEMFLQFAAIAAAGFKTAWSVAGAVAGSGRICIGPGSAATDAGADNMAMHSGLHGFATTVSYGDRSSASNEAGAVETALVTTTGSGTLTLQWAQTTTNATGSTLGTNSFMRVTRVS